MNFIIYVLGAVLLIFGLALVVWNIRLSSTSKSGNDKENKTDAFQNLKSQKNIKSENEKRKIFKKQMKKEYRDKLCGRLPVENNTRLMEDGFENTEICNENLNIESGEFVHSFIERSNESNKKLKIINTNISSYDNTYNKNVPVRERLKMASERSIERKRQEEIEQRAIQIYEETRMVSVPVNYQFISPQIKNESDTAIICPKCKSRNAYHARGNGFGLGKAAVGGLLLGPVGLLGGLIGSKNLVLQCVKCGKKWSP